MVPSSNFKQSYYDLEYTFLPNLVEIEGREGYELTKIGRK